MTRQQRWANNQRAKGLCTKCCRPAIGLYCQAHAEQHRTRNRNAYRAKVNKPLDSNHQSSKTTV